MGDIPFERNECVRYSPDDAEQQPDACRRSALQPAADLTAPEGHPSVAHCIRKLLPVSDNDAFNRLYEFVGQAEINEFLRAKGEVESRREKANRPDLSRFMFDDQGNSISGLARPATQRIDRPANTTTHSSARTSQLRANSRKRVMTRLVVRCT